MSSATSGWPIAPLAPATKIFISILSMPFQASPSPVLQMHPAARRFPNPRRRKEFRPSRHLRRRFGIEWRWRQQCDERWHEKTEAGEMGAGSQRAGAGLYGDVRVLWARRPTRIGGDDRPRARSGRDLFRHI